jgi:hypothetical protein
MSEPIPSQTNFSLTPEDAYHVEASHPTSPKPRERRATPRFSFIRPKMFIVRVDGLPAAITLKDISCGGASGLMSEPLTEGSRLVIEFDPRTHVAAKVRWVSRMTIGLKFLTPLEPSFVAALCKRQAARG